MNGLMTEGTNGTNKIHMFSNPHSPVNKNELTVTSTKSGQQSKISRFDEKSTKMKRNTINYAQNNN